MTITETLNDRDSVERAILKAQAYVSLSTDTTKISSTITIGQYNIVIKKIFFDTKDNCLTIDIIVQKNNKIINVNGPWKYYNPPILFVNDDGTMEENLPKVFVSMISNTLQYFIDKYKL